MIGGFHHSSGGSGPASAGGRTSSTGQRGQSRTRAVRAIGTRGPISRIAAAWANEDAIGRETISSKRANGRAINRRHWTEDHPSITGGG